MKRNEAVSKLMSRDLITVHHGDPISKVRQILNDHNLHHVPVVNGDQLIGIISYSDVLRLSFGEVFKSDPRAVDAALDHALKLEDVMQKDVTTLTEHSTIREASEILAKGKFHSLPVVNGGKLVGMVTSTDLIRFLLDQY